MSEQNKTADTTAVSVAKDKLSETSIAQNPSGFNAETLIAQAISQQVPVETMEKLLAMRRELKAEWAKEQFDKAMAQFQSEIGTIEKKKKVSFNTTNYSYAPLEDIVDQVKDALARNGLSYSFDTVEADKAIKLICYATHIAGYTKSSSLTIEIDQASKMNKTQQYGSANSYGKRYAFCNAFGILTGDEDNDAQTEAPKSFTAPLQAKRDYSAPKPTDKQKDLIKSLKEQKGYTTEDLFDEGFTAKSSVSEIIKFLLDVKPKSQLPVIQHLTPAEEAEIV